MKTARTYALPVQAYQSNIQDRPSGIGWNFLYPFELQHEAFLVLISCLPHHLQQKRDNIEDCLFSDILS